MSKESLNSLLDAARKLPLDEQKQLAEQLLRDAENAALTKSQIQEAVEAVERTNGSMQGLNRETIIRLAEDEELFGY